MISYLSNLLIKHNFQNSLDLRKIVSICQQNRGRYYAILYNSQVEYYNKMYFVDLSLRPLIQRFCFNPFYSSALITIFTYPFITKTSLSDGIISGIKIALIGPLLAYALLDMFPSNYTIFLIYLITNIIRSFLSSILFSTLKRSSLGLHSLGILLAGALRGVLLYNCWIFLSNRRFNSNDIFFISMMTKNLLEPLFSKIENNEHSIYILQFFKFNKPSLESIINNLY